MKERSIILDFLQREAQKIINSPEYIRYQMMLRSGQIDKRQFDTLTRMIGKSGRDFNSHSDSEEDA